MIKPDRADEKRNRSRLLQKETLRYIYTAFKHKLDPTLFRIRRLFGQIYQHIVPRGTGAERAIKAGIWVTAYNLLGSSLQLLLLLVLARLFSPSTFGLIAISLLLLTAYQYFKSFGLDAALISHSNENVDEYLDTAWSLSIIEAFVLTAVTFLFAPTIAAVFHRPQMTVILRVISVVPIILGLRNPGVIYFEKELESQKQFVYQLSGTVVEFSLCVCLALLYRNVWAFVIGRLVGETVRSCVSYLIHGYRPSPSVELERAKELFNYGKWLTIANVIFFLAVQGDDVFVGWFLGTTALSFYQLAYRLSNTPATEVSHVVAQVAFPMYSKLQSDAKRLKESYFKTMQITVLMSAPMAIGILVVTPLFVLYFLGENWRPMIVPMQLLTVYGFGRALESINGALYNAVSRPDYQTKLGAIDLVLLSLSIFPAAIFGGITGVSLAFAIESIIMLGANCYLALTIINGSFTRLLKVLTFPVVASLTMGWTLVVIRDVFYFERSLVSLVLVIVLGIAFYACSILTLGRYTSYNGLSQVRIILTSLLTTDE